MDKLESMRAFTRAVDRGSFAKAARELRVSAAMVGKHVRFLEETLGVPLLLRTTRRQKLTPEGEVYVARCRRILEEVADSESFAQRSTDAPTGTLRVNAPTTFGVYALAPSLAAFAATAPDVRLELTLNDRVVDLVDEGFDVAIRIGPLAPSSLRARRLADYDLAVAASPAYLARKGAPRTVADLDRHDLLGFLSSGVSSPWHFSGARGPRTHAVSARFASNSGAALRQMALAGLGVLAQPRLLLEADFAEGRLVPLLESYALPRLPMHAVYPETRHPLPKLRAFVDFLVERFGTSPRRGARQARVHRRALGPRIPKKPSA